MRLPEKVVIVGSSVAGVRCATALRTDGFEGDVVLVGSEYEQPYDKPPLSKQILSGEQGESDIRLIKAADYSDGSVELRLGVAASGLDHRRKQLVLADGEHVTYDALVIATGVRARPWTGSVGSAIWTVRQLDDATTLHTRLRQGGPLVVVGGGFIGAEVASAARRLGNDVAIVEATSAPFARVLGPDVGRLVTSLHATEGVEIFDCVPVTEIGALPEGALVHLADGRRIEAATVVVGIGCIANTEWLEGSGVQLEDGILTDEFCSVPGVDDVYAIGDVARWFDVRSGQIRRVEHWTNAVEQAHLVAHNITHPGARMPHRKVPYFWSDQYETKIQMAGDVRPSDAVQVFQCGTGKGDRTIALYTRDGVFSGAVTFGWPRALASCRQLWDVQATITDVVEKVQQLSDRMNPLFV